MNNKFAKLLIISSFFLNILEIFSRNAFNDGSSKRKKHKDKFNKDGNSGINLLASQIISNNLGLLDNREEIKNLLKNEKYIGEREKKEIEYFEEKFDEYYKEKTREVKKHLEIIEECLTNLKKFNFNCSDIKSIKAKISCEVDNINKIYEAVKIRIKERYGFNVPDDKLGGVIKKIKQIKIEEFNKVLSEHKKMVKEINNRLDSAENFVNSVDALRKLQDDIDFTDTKKSLKFLEKFAKYNSALKNIQNSNLEGSTFFNNIGTKNLLNKTEEEECSKNYKNLTVKSLIEFKYKSFIDKFNHIFSIKTQDLKDKLTVFENDINKEDLKIETIFTNNGLDFAKSTDYKNEEIKKKFAGKDTSVSIDVFSNEINKKNKDYSDKINNFKKIYSGFSKEFEKLEEIKKKILENEISYRKKDLKLKYNSKTKCFDEVTKKLTEIDENNKKIEENCKKYSELANETKNLKEKFSSDAEGVKYNKEVTINLKDSDEDIQKKLNIIYARVKLSKEDSFILSNAEFKALQECIKNEKVQIIKFIEEKEKRLTSYNTAIEKLKKDISDNETKLKDNIKYYNESLKKKEDNNKDYLNKIRDANEKIIAKVNKFENDGYRKIILEKISENFYTHFRNLNKDITANGNEIANFDNNSFGIKLFINKIPDEFKQKGQFAENNGFNIEPKNELDKIINDVSNEIGKLNTVNEDICKKIETLKKNKKSLEGKLAGYKNNKETLEEEIKSLNKFFGDNKQILTIYKDDKTLCDKYKDIVKNISNTSTNLEGVKINKITGENTEGQLSKALDNKENDLGHDKDVVEKYNVKVFKEYNVEESNLCKAYKLIYNVNQLNGETLDDEDGTFYQIRLRCETLSGNLESFRKELYKFSILIKKLDTANLIKLDDNCDWFLKEPGEYLKKGKFVTSSSLYFLEYFYHKNKYLEIDNDINNIYNLLIQYKALLDVKNKSNEFEKQLETLNIILSRYFDKLFQFKSGKLILNKNFKNSLEYNKVLGEEKFLDYFEKLCNFYKLTDYDGSNDFIKEILRIINDIKDLDDIRNADGSLKEKDIIDEINKIYKYINEIKGKFEDFSTHFLGKFDVSKKFDIILGNNLYCSDLEILNKYIGKIISEFVLLKEKGKSEDKSKGKSKDKSIFEEDNINFKNLKFEEEDKIKHIFSILQICTYYKKIFNEEDSFFQSLIDLIAKKLDILYSDKIYKILKDLRNAFDNNNKNNNSFLGHIFDFNTNTKKLKKKMDLLYKCDKEGKEAEDSVFYMEDGIRQSKLILSDKKLKNIIENASTKESVKNASTEKYLTFAKFNKTSTKEYNFSKKITENNPYFKENCIGFVNSILYIWKLQHELYKNLCDLNIRYKGFVKFSDIEKIKFSKEVQKLDVVFEETADHKGIHYAFKQNAGENAELKVVLKSVNKILQKIYYDIKMLYISKYYADNIDNCNFSKEIAKFFTDNIKIPEENVKIPKENFYNKVDDKDIILECSEKILELLNDKGYDDLKKLLKHTKIIGDKNFYFNYLFREKFAAKFTNFFNKIKNKIFNNEFFKYECFNVAKFNNEGKITNSDVVIQNFTVNSIDCKKCFNYILNHVNFWGKFFKVFNTVNELLINLEFFTKDDEGVITTNDKLFSCPEYLEKYFEDFKILSSLLEPSKVCTIKSSDKITEIKIPSIHNMLAVFSELIYNEIVGAYLNEGAHLNEGVMRYDMLNEFYTQLVAYLEKGTDNKILDKFLYKENDEENDYKSFERSNHNEFLFLLSNDEHFKILIDIFGVKNDGKIFEYDISNILKNYGFGGDGYVIKTFNDIVKKFPNAFVLNGNKKNYSLNYLAVLVRIIVEKINNFKISNNYDYDVPKYVKDNFYNYIKDCLEGIKKYIDNAVIIDNIFNSLNNAKYYCEDIIAYDSRPFDYNKNGKISYFYSKLSDHLDYIFGKDENKLKKELDLFLDNFLLIKAYYDIINYNTEVYPINYYSEEIAKKLKNSDLNTFYTEFEKKLFSDHNNINIFNYLISKKIEFDIGIEGDDNYAKLVNLYKKLNNCLDDSVYIDSAIEKGDKDNNEKILKELNDIYSKLEVRNI